MITANELIFTIRALIPAIKAEDHGRIYWVGMPVDADGQIGDAFIMEDREEFREPIYEQILDEDGEFVRYGDQIIAYGEVIGHGPNRLWQVQGADQPTMESLLAKWADPGVKAAYAEASRPPPKTVFTALDFRDRFTTAEQLAIRQAQMADMEVGVVYDMFQVGPVDVADPRTTAGIDVYIAKGLVDPDRRAALLAPELFAL